MTASIRACALPSAALLQKYRDDDGPGYTDCFSLQVKGQRSLSDFINAFYTSRLFRMERLVLKVFAGRPSSDADVIALADGTSSTFAAWTVEERGIDQILLCDLSGRTRSWLMVETAAKGGTLLRFGSAVVPQGRRGDPATSLGWLFAALMPAHRLYSRALLHYAGKGLR